VNRAGKGLHLTAYDRPGATGKQLDMQETIAQLESALELAKVLAASANGAKADPADTDAQQQMKEDFDGLKRPCLLMSTPASAGIVAGDGVQLSAQDSISTVAGKNADWSVLKRFAVAAGEKVSLFAQKLGIKIFAAKGPVEVQAQSGPMSLIADKDVNVASVNGKVSLAAAKEIILECGGAFIHMKDGSITLGGPGDLFLKTITVQKKSKDSLRLPMTALPIPVDMQRFSNLLDLSGLDEIASERQHAWANARYYVTDKNGTILASGPTDQYGVGSRFFTREQCPVDVWVEGDEWLASEELRGPNDSQAEGDATA
jgi:type VI secretion system secreted protein VgrG